MSDVATSLPFDADLHFVVKSGGKLYVTTGAYIYDPAQPDPTTEESAAIAFLTDQLGSGDVAVLEPDPADTGAFILWAES